ncbi:protein-L-isoaspartate(D-aspartate) O-methyltransferase [Nitrospirota bacterium]
MVETQLLPRGIRDKRVLAVMRKLPRHLFVPKDHRASAYNDCALPITDEQTISQPYMVAVMTELLELTGKEKVLEIGTGSGYQTALLRELASEVHTVERIRNISEIAERTLDSLGYKNIHFHVKDGTLGVQEEAPFERILITAGAPQIPEPLLAQLADDGIMIIPTGEKRSQRLLRLFKHRGELQKTYHTGCIFVPLIGEHGWKED